MTLKAIDYAKVLVDLNIPEDCVYNTKVVLNKNNELQSALINPTISKKDKHAVIDAIFYMEIRNFLKVVCDHGDFKTINDIFDAYQDMTLQHKNMIKATLDYVTRPDAEQIINLKAWICKKYNKSDALIELKENPSLLGGFIVTIGDMQYDRSIKSSLLHLKKLMYGGETERL